VSVEDGADDLAWAEGNGWTVVERLRVQSGPSGLWEPATEPAAALQLLALDRAEAA
jgi:hypothetical protein